MTLFSIKEKENKNFSVFKPIRKEKRYFLKDLRNDDENFRPENHEDEFIRAIVFDKIKEF